MQKGYYENLALANVMNAASSLRSYVTTRHDALLTKIRTKAALDAEIESELKSACDSWLSTFKA